MKWESGSDSIRSLFTLDPSVSFLNHGSFGAAPRSVQEAQARWRAELEREPVLFIARRLPAEVDAVRARVAAFVKAAPEGLVFVPNATTGVATVLHNLPWQAGDEVVMPDHGYNAVRQAVHYLGDRYGVKLVEAKVPFPLSSPDEVTAAFAAALTERTKLVIVDHITSPTALIFPVADIIALAKRRGIPVLVDGAHAPGMLPLDLDALGADFYTGNLHKWVCAPKGIAFLHVGAAWRERLQPVVISHGYGGDLHARFDFTGTDDPTALLSVPAALDHLEQLGLETVRAVNHALVRTGRVVIASALGVDLPHPDDPRLYGSMATIPVPFTDLPPALTARLYEEHRIEVPFINFGDRRWVRISGQVYNRAEEYERLAAVLKQWSLGGGR